MAMRFGLAIACVTLGCTSTAAPIDPGSDETFTMTTSPAPATVPAVAPVEAPWGPAPWIGRLVPESHHYSNGCIDHRQVEILALARGEMRVPIVIGWRHATANYIGEPHFLSSKEQLSGYARRSSVPLTYTVPDGQGAIRDRENAHVWPVEKSRNSGLKTEQISARRLLIMEACARFSSSPFR